MSQAHTALTPLGPVRGRRDPIQQSPEESDATASVQPDLARMQLRAAIHFAIDGRQPASASSIQLLERIAEIFEQRARERPNSPRIQFTPFPQALDTPHSLKRKCDSLDEDAGSIVGEASEFTTLFNLKQLISRKRAELARQTRC